MANKMKQRSETEVYEFTCKKCGKVIKSITKTQFDYNVGAHKLSCNEIKQSRKS
jgi:hypothetical protein